MSDQGFMQSAEERRRLLEANAAAGRFFELATMRSAGLGLLDPEGRTVDRFRDRLMFPARNDRLQTVGFVGARDATPPYYVTSPTTQVHRRSHSLVGVAEQLDLLSEGATPVLVNDPLDAVAIERISRLTVGRWAGIPMCDALLSAGQAGILGRYAATDTAIVVVADDKAAQRAAVGFRGDLSRFFTRVWAVELPSDQSASTLATMPGGLQQLHDALMVTRPLADYPRPQPRRRPTPVAPAVDPEPPEQTPSL